MSTREMPPVRAGIPHGDPEIDPTATAATAIPPATTRTRTRRRANGQSAGEQLLLGRYRCTRRLGSGSFGTVWAARDERLERDVAVKILPRERIVGGRFEREARVTARLSHPAIVTLYEAVVDDDGAYLVSELVRGRTLDGLLAEGHLSDRDILALAISLCDALGHAHEQGVVHRDVKPSNILVPARPTSPAHPAKLTDFGVARVVGGDSLTGTGDVIGTAAYMAPEQAEGREATPAADLYSLALVVYEALTGVNPNRELMASRYGRPSRRLGAHLPPLRRQRRELPREMGVSIDQALRPRPSERGSVDELRRALALSLDRVSERAGIVEPGWQLTEPFGGHDDRPDEPGPEWREDRAQRQAAGPQAGGRHGRVAEETAAFGDRLRTAILAPEPRSWPIRGANAAGGGLAAAWLSAHLLVSAPVAPAAAGLIVAAALLLVPRLGWLVCVGVLVAVALIQGRTAGGLALLLGTGGSGLLLLMAGEVWALPALSTLLGGLGLGVAWPAVVGRSGLPWWQRSVVAGAGFVWTAAAGTLTGQSLLWHAPRLPPGSVWTGSVPIALDDVLAPLVRHGLLTGALVWGAAAAVLPWVSRGRRLPGELIVVAVWSAGTVAAAEAVGADPLHGVVLGALAGALIAIWPALSAWLRHSGRPAGVSDRLP